jgi:hypothetical protein
MEITVPDHGVYQKNTQLVTAVVAHDCRFKENEVQIESRWNDR